MNILITGALGFAGCSISEYLLKNNYNIIGVDKLLFNTSQLSYFNKNKNFIFYKYDLNNYKKIENIFKNHKINTIIHLAAIVGDPASKKNPKLTKQTNLDSSIELFKISKKYGVKSFIFFSTCSNYGISSQKKLLKESDNLKPLSPYAKTKVYFEKYLLRDKSNIKKIILRISTLYGTSRRMRYDLTINEFTKKIFKKEKFDIYHADTWRPYLNLVDLNNILLKILKKNFSSLTNVFNVGFSEENFTKRQIIKKISNNFKIKKNDIFRFVDTQHFDKRDYKVNFSKIKKIGIKKHISLNMGIKKIISYLKTSKKNDVNNRIYYNHK